MVVGGEFYQANLWSRQAIERLTRDGLPATPENYKVYYHYFAGDKPALKTAYDIYVARGGFSQVECTELYERFLVRDGTPSFLKDASTILDCELKKVMELLAKHNKGADEFGQNLDSFSGKLSSSDSLDTLREAVGKIATETKRVSDQNRKLQLDLTAASAQLDSLREDFDRAHREAQTDPLTEVGNRKFFDIEIARAIKESSEQNSVLSLLMVDIDHFKKFNDSYGHLIGDQVLRLVAQTLVENLKGRDVIARYGGEEFVILLPHTRLRDAELVANQLRAVLSTKQIKKRGSNEVLGIITISIGAAQYTAKEDIDALVARADAALYKAKQSGRNKVICAE